MAQNSKKTPRAVQAKKIEWIKETRVLQKQVAGIEREIKNHLSSKRVESEKHLLKVMEDQMKAEEDLKKEANTILQRRKRMQDKVTRFRRKVETVNPSQPEALESIKADMEDVETEVREFKVHQRTRYEEIMREDQRLQLEIEAFEEHMATWSHEDSLASASSHSARSVPASIVGKTDVTQDLLPEAAEFDLFLRKTGGHRGGWDEYDHGTFLKFRNRHPRREVFIAECSGALATRSEAEVREHERWYREYLQLQERKKDAIAQWRANRQTEREQEAAAGAQQEAERARAAEACVKEKEELREREKEVKRARVSAWKVKKELERAQEEERKIRDVLEKQKKEDSKRVKQGEERLLVSARREKVKQDQEEVEALETARSAREKRERQVWATHNLHRFRQRDMAAEETRQQQRRREEHEREEKARRLQKLKSQVVVEVSRDPNRLLQPTRGSEARVMDREKPGGRVYSMPHRAVPTWRRPM